MSDKNLIVPSRGGTATLGSGDSGSVELQHDRADQLLKHGGSDGTVRTLVDTSSTQTLTSKTLTNPVINGASGTAFADRTVKTAVTAIGGAALHAGVLNWQNPEAVSILILRALFDLTTASSGACTVDVGTTAVSATTASDNLIDGFDANASVALFDNITDVSTNGKSRQKLAAAKWVTVKEASGNATGLVGNLIVQYILA